MHHEAGADPRALLAAIDIRDDEFQPGRIEGDAAFGNDARQDCVAAAARMMQDQGLRGVDDEVERYARKPKIAGELDRDVELARRRR